MVHQPRRGCCTHQHDFVERRVSALRRPDYCSNKALPGHRRWSNPPYVYSLLELRSYSDFRTPSGPNRYAAHVGAASMILTHCDGQIMSISRHQTSTLSTLPTLRSSIARTVLSFRCRSRSHSRCAGLDLLPNWYCRTYNDPGEYYSFINGTGAPDIYGIVSISLSVLRRPNTPV